MQCITRFIENAPPDYRLAGLYVIDAISRAVHKQLRKREENNEKGFFELEGYLKRFAIVLKEDSLQGCFEPCSVKDKVRSFLPDCPFCFYLYLVWLCFILFISIYTYIIFVCLYVHL